MLEQKTKLRKKCVSYFKKKNYIKKIFGCRPCTIVKFFERIVNYNLKSPLERRLIKKRPTINASAIFNFFGAMDHYIKDNVQ